MHRCSSCRSEPAQSDPALEPTEADGLVDYLCDVGHRQAIHFLWRPTLSDLQDEFILELAVAARCDAIVTHNVRDFAWGGRIWRNHRHTG